MAEPQPMPRKMSGVGFAASRLSQRVSTVLKPSSTHAPTQHVTNNNHPAPVQAPTPVNKNGAAVTLGPDSLLEQIKHYEKEGFIPPRSCCGFNRVSIGKVNVSGGELTFRIMVVGITYFDVTIENGATASTIEKCTLRVGDFEKLNSRGKSITDPKTGIIAHPAFKSGPGMGSWLPHYAIGVLVYLVLRLLEDVGVEVEIANAAVGPVGFDLGLPLGLALVKGKRQTMEDYKLIHPTQKGIALFGVFDGHGGFTAAEYAAKNLALNFHNSFANPVVAVDYQSRALGVRRALRMAFEETDRKFLADTKETSGSTACVAAIDLENLVIHVANVGDTRCILCREGKAMDLSIDHKANHPAEIARVLDAGGFVARGRALGLLAIARALGDRDLKRQGGGAASPITAAPDCDSFVLDPSRDEFILIACDGLFDVMSSQQVVAFVRARLAEGLTEDAAVAALANHAIETLGSLDNVTVILIGLNWQFVGIITTASTPRSMRAPTIKRSESATVRAAKASAHKRQTSRMSSTESSSASISDLRISGQ